MIEPNSLQQHAIEQLRDQYDTLGCVPYAPIGTRTWLVAAFEQTGSGSAGGSTWRELKRWRILPNGDVYEVLPGTPSSDQPIAPPAWEAIAGDLTQRDVELRLVVRHANLPLLLEGVGCTGVQLKPQPDGRYGLAIEHANLPSPMIDTTAGFVAGTADQLPERR